MFAKVLEDGMASGISAAPVLARPIKFHHARREQNSLSSGPERRLLIWLAERTPAGINSDHLTLLGAVSMLTVGLCYAWARWSSLGLPLATLALALNWLGDSLDGTLARVRGRQRPRYGFYVDHVVDTFGALFLTSGLAVSGYLDWRIAAGMLIAFLMLSIETYLATYTLGTFKLSFWKFGPTELRIMLAAGNIALWLKPASGLSGHRLFDVGGAIAIAGMMAMLVSAAVQHTVRLYREERLS
jgi:phosphatidylglycerophosphate synthase